MFLNKKKKNTYIQHRLPQPYNIIKPYLKSIFLNFHQWLLLLPPDSSFVFSKPKTLTFFTQITVQSSPQSLIQHLNLRFHLYSNPKFHHLLLQVRVIKVKDPDRPGN
ncbi:hypothetical protein Hanom_Chr12g01077541 [Helianthus anomalus]